MDRMRFVLALILTMLSLSSAAQEPVYALDADAIWQEAVVSVRDLDRTIAHHREIAGWEVLQRGSVDPALLRQWHLPEGVTADFALMHNPPDKTGFVRFISFQGTEDQRVIRANAQAWDTGGIFSLMVYADDLDAVWDRARKLGWHGYNEPVTFYSRGVTLKNMVLRGPDGVTYGVYQRVTPPHPYWQGFEALSRPFNAMMMVRDAEGTAEWYKQALGLIAWRESEFTDPAEMSNNFGLPRWATDEVVRRTRILQPPPLDREFGRVELMEFVGWSSRDLKDRAVPPNLGPLALRYPVSDIDERIAHMESIGTELWTQPAEVTMAPYGKVRTVAVRAPNGVIVEFFEPLEGE